jgi:hypothetical protein
MKEIEIVQGNIARFDTNGSNIKSWCVTTWAAVSAYALTERDAPVAALGIAIILGFGVLELIYRGFQLRFIDRAAEIEKGLGCGNLDSYVYSIDKTAGTRMTKEFRRVLARPHFTVFYIVFILFSGLITWYCWMYPSDGSHFDLRIK